MNEDAGSLDRMHDLVAPPPVPWWPPAPGWYWLLGFLLLLAGIFAVRAFLRWQHNRYRREALEEWRRLQPLLNATARRREGLAGLAVLLKRTALTAFPRRRTAALTGERWQAFLRQTCVDADFQPALVAVMERAAYDSQLAVDEEQARAAAAATHRWIAHHRVPGKDPASVETGEVSC